MKAQYKIYTAAERKDPLGIGETIRHERYIATFDEFDHAKDAANLAQTTEDWQPFGGNDGSWLLAAEVWEVTGNTKKMVHSVELSDYMRSFREGQWIVEIPRAKGAKIVAYELEEFTYMGNVSYNWDKMAAVITFIDTTALHEWAAYQNDPRVRNACGLE